MAVKLESMVEQTPEDAARVLGAGDRGAAGEMSLGQRRRTPFAITRRLAFDRDNDASLITSLALARDNARQVREALSNEVWEKSQPALSAAGAGDHGFHLGAYARRGCSARRWRKCTRWKA